MPNAWECLNGATRNTSKPSSSGDLPYHRGGKRHFLTENRERANYASLDYTPRLEVIGGENEEVNGILIEWAEVRLEDDCAQTLLKIQILTNVMQRLLDGE